MSQPADAPSPASSLGRWLAVLVIAGLLALWLGPRGLDDSADPGDPGAASEESQDRGLGGALVRPVGDGGPRLELLGATKAALRGTLRDPEGEGEGRRKRQAVDLRAGAERAGVDITLKPGGVAIHGTVSDLSGGVLEGARVSVGGAFTRSDDEGRFTPAVGHRFGGDGWRGAPDFAVDLLEFTQEM